MINENQLLKAINKEGFNLEASVQKIFERKGFKATQNYQINNSPGIDVFAFPKNNWETYHTIFVIQCKGSDPNNVLQLFGESKKCIETDMVEGITRKGNNIIHHQLPVLRYSADKKFYSCKPNPTLDKIIPISTAKTKIFPIGLRYCFSGDFRNSQKDFKKMPRNDIKNNLYKGITQLVTDVETAGEDIKAVTKESLLKDVAIFPLIITNTQIYVKEMTEQENLAVQWAIYGIEYQRYFNNTYSIYFCS